MLEIKGSNKDVLEAIARARDGELVLKRKVSTLLLARIMQNVEITRIVCSPAIYGSLPTSAVNALENMGVEISVESVKRGRPDMHPREKLSMIAEMRGQGLGADEIAHRLNLPLRTVYYRLHKKRL